MKKSETIVPNWSAAPQLTTHCALYFDNNNRLRISWIRMLDDKIKIFHKISWVSGNISKPYILIPKDHVLTLTANPKVGSKVYAKHETFSEYSYQEVEVVKVLNDNLVGCYLFEKDTSEHRLIWVKEAYEICSLRDKKIRVVLEAFYNAGTDHQVNDKSLSTIIDALERFAAGTLNVSSTE